MKRRHRCIYFVLIILNIGPASVIFGVSVNDPFSFSFQLVTGIIPKNRGTMKPSTSSPVSFIDLSNSWPSKVQIYRARDFYIRTDNGHYDRLLARTCTRTVIRTIVSIFFCLRESRAWTWVVSAGGSPKKEEAPDRRRTPANCHQEDNY